MKPVLIFFGVFLHRDVQVGVKKLPQFGMIRVGGKTGTIGLLSMELADGAAATNWTPEQRAAIHVELSTDNLDALYREAHRPRCSLSHSTPR